MTLETHEALKEEVKKLITNGVIGEVLYSMWVSNLVLVVKTL